MEEIINVENAGKQKDMNNLKKPEEYATECGVFKESKIVPMNLNLYRDAHVKSQRDIVKAVQLAQRDAYNKAIDNILSNGIVIKTSDNYWEMYPDGLADDVYSYNHIEETYSYADKDSILKLKIE